MNIQQLFSKLQIAFITVVILCSWIDKRGSVKGSRVKGGSYSSSKSSASYDQHEESQQPYQQQAYSSCIKPESPVNGRISCRYEFGLHTCTAQCIDGFHFPDRSTLLETQCHEEQNVWAPYNNFVDCIFYNPSCEPPAQIRNGAIYCTSNSITKQCQGKCDPGHDFPGGVREKVIKCNLESGKWNPVDRFEDCYPQASSCESPPQFQNGVIYCSSDSYTKQCQGTCNPGYEFPDRNRQKSLTCYKQTGKWNPTEKFDDCQLLCHPPCENGGKCATHNQCFCPSTYRGNRCQYAVSLCDFGRLNARMVQYNCTHNAEYSECYLSCPPGMTFDPPSTTQYRCTVNGLWNPPHPPSCTRSGACDKPPTPMNGQLTCSGNNEVMICTARCINGFLFPNGFAEMVIQCRYRSGQWTPDVNFPDCKPTCNPECRHGGRCVGHNQCICTHEFRGSRCEYPISNCNPREFLSSVASRCQIKQEETICQVSCSHYEQTLDPPQPTVYTCSLDGHWLPPTKPDCLSDTDYKIDMRTDTQRHQQITNVRHESSSSHSYQQEWTHHGQSQSAVDYDWTQRHDHDLQKNRDMFDEDAQTLDKTPDGWTQQRLDKMQDIDQSHVSQTREDDGLSQSQYGGGYMDGQERLENEFGQHETEDKTGFGQQEVIEEDFEKHHAYETGHIKTKSESESESRVGFQREREDENSHDVEVVSNYRGICSVWGFPHYRTFDGGLFSFAGTCQYVLVSDCGKDTYQIRMQHKCIQRNIASHYCFQEVEVQWHKSLYHLSPADGLSYEGETIPIPAVVNGVVVEKISMYLVMKLTTGLSVWLTDEGSVHVTASPMQRGQLCGLCGNYDQNPINDFVSPTGDNVYDITAFGNSWKTLESKKDCVDNAFHYNPCSSETPEKRIVSEKSTLACFTINSFQYDSCHKVVDPSIYLRKCQMDCCNEEAASGCECQSFREYFLECGRAGGDTAQGWRTPALCPLLCVNGTIYQECGPMCPPTCNNQEPFCPNSKCVDGCHCPKGTVSENGHYIPTEECPCTHGTKKYQSGETMSSDCNTCLCQGGQWQCTEEICPATCTVAGAHITTFDGIEFDLYSKCPHYLYESDDDATSYRVTIDYSNDCDYIEHESTSNCIKSITIHTLEGATVKLKNDFEVIVNGKVVDSLPVSAPGVVVGQATSVFLKAELRNGLQLFWDGHQSIHVHAPVSLYDHTRGLCGTFNKNQADELLTPEGDTELTCGAFADKWLVNENCMELEFIDDNVCEKSTHFREKIIHTCSYIKKKIFENCHSYVDPDSYFSICVQSLCNCRRDWKECFCASIASYGSACARRGIPINWRQSLPECAIHCPMEDQIYDPCARTCSYSCGEISHSEGHCQQNCVEGCVCPPGHTMDDHHLKCVPISTCSCMHSGHIYPPEFLQRREKEMCECSEAKWDCRVASPEDLILTPPPNVAPVCLSSSNQEATLCLSECPVTCANFPHHQPCTVVTCKPGCQCKDGYVLHAESGSCVLRESCPCHHAGMSYQGGSKIKMDCNSCLCAGGQWHCETNPCSGICSSWGDSHYKTFDGRMFDFQGECDYILAKGYVDEHNVISIVIQNVLCGTQGVTCSKSVTVALGDDAITLSTEDPVPEVSKNSKLKISQLGMFVLVHTGVGISVQWDRGTRVYVIAQPVWKDKLKGLCGDFNSDASEDFKPPSGGLPLASPHEFADSWRVHDYCPSALTLLDTCNKTPERLKWATEKCSILKSEMFEPCHTHVEVEDYHRRCLFDTCACDTGGDCECFCAVVSAYSQECARHDIIIPWRSQKICPIQCETCDHYSPCISLCPPPNCETLNDENEACRREPCVEGCEKKPCEQGFVFISSNNFTCIPEESCLQKPCAVINGITYKEGERIEDLSIGDACQSCYCRHGLPDCVGVPCSTSSPIPTIASQIQDCEMTGWTEWINSLDPEFNYGQDREDIKELIYTRRIPCPYEHVTSVQCRDADTKVPSESVQHSVTCTVKEGLMCNNSYSMSCPDFEMRVYCSCTKEETCPEGQSWLKCAFQCNSMCHSLSQDLISNGHCNSHEECIDGCSTAVCHSPYVRRDPDTCTMPDMCTCRLEDGYLLAPGEVITNGCKKCQCLNNMLICSTLVECQSTTTLMEPGTPYSETTPQKLEIAMTDATVPQWIEEVEEEFRTPKSKKTLKIEEIETITQKTSTVRTTPPPSGIVTKPISCSYWSDWINRSKPKERRGDREETLPFVLRQTEGFCKEGEATEIECRDARSGILYHETGEKKLTCSLQSGFICDNKDQPDNKCLDYKIRYYCSCEKETTIFVKPTTPTYIYPCTEYVQLINGISPLPDTQLKASSSFSTFTGPQNARLTTTTSKGAASKAWSPKTADEHQFIEVDLSEIRAVYGIVTKGKTRAKEWVTAYRLLYSKDGNSYSYYSNYEDKPKIFSANFDDSSESKYIFGKPFEARFVRLEPIGWENAIAFQFDLYGCSEAIQSTTPAFGEYIATVMPPIKECTEQRGLQWLPDFQLSVSSWQDDIHSAKEARLGADETWMAKNVQDKQFIQIDFINPANITGIITKGRHTSLVDQWVTAYYVAFSQDGIEWSKVTDLTTNIPKEFAANYDAESVVTNMLPTMVRTRYLRIIPTKYKTWVSMQLEVIGCFVQLPCQDPMGIENGLISEYQLSASSQYNKVSMASSARFSSPYGWSPRKSNKNQFLQVDFVTPMNISAVVTRGRHDFPKWVTLYQVAYSNDGINFEKVLGKHGEVEEFVGNFDKDTAVTNLLPNILTARFLRILPVQWKMAIGLRIEILGCYVDNVCLEPLGLDSGLISNHQLSSSSQKDIHTNAANARMNDPQSWSATYTDAKPYLQVDFGTPKDIAAVVTKGRGDVPEWVTKYEVSYSNDLEDWKLVKDDYGNVKTFSGNYDQENSVVNLLSHQPLKTRYIRILPTEYENGISLRLELLGCIQFDECREPLGMENGMIYDYQISSSSFKSKSLSPEHSRIDSDTAWSAVIDENQYLQIDLIEDVKVSGLITKGYELADEWVSSYFVAYSSDGHSWNVIKDSLSEDVKVFLANYDGDSPVTAWFPEVIVTRFLKIVPVKYANWMSMRIEVLGCYHPQTCLEPMGLEQGLISDSQIRASSSYDRVTTPAHARLNRESSWSAADVHDEQYLEVDFETPTNITAVIIKGKPDTSEYVQTFQIRYTVDGVHWMRLLDDFGGEKEFAGNVNADSPVIVVLPESIELLMLRIYPIDFNDWVSLQLEVLGCRHPEAREEILPMTPPALKIVEGCPDSSEVEHDILDSAEIYASSSAPNSNPYLVRMSGMSGKKGEAGSWVPHVQDLHPVIIVQFPEEQYITAIRMQGRPDEEQWVKSLRVIASKNNITWFPVFGPNGNELIDGNSDQNTIDGHYFKEPVNAMFIKIMPETWHRWPSFRMELIGCTNHIATTVSTIIVPPQLCPELDSSFLLACPPSCPPGLVCDGENCVDPANCVCMHNGEVYNVGNRIEDDQCYQCDCSLGGYSVCQKKTCPLCPKGQKQIWLDKCKCECTKCRDGSTLCPTDGTCVAKDRWCDGIVDCSDDEVNCIIPPKPSTIAPKLVDITTEIPKPLIVNDVCDIMGPHIKTLDGQDIVYDHCHHIALKDILQNSFSVLVHKSCEIHGTCLHWVEVVTHDHLIKVTSDLEVHFDSHDYTQSQLVLLNKRPNTNITIEKIGEQVVIKILKNDVKVVYDTLAHLKIQVPSTMYKKVSGLCGYYSGVPEDDQKKADGQAAYTSEDFGDSWASVDHSADCVPVVCPHEIMALALDACSKLNDHPFNMCSSVVSANNHIDFCMSSMCECLQKVNSSAESCICDSYLPFVEACENHLGPTSLRNWRLMFGCIPSCPEGMLWNDCGPSCQLTCDTPTLDDLDTCAEECVAGCFCPDGLVSNGNACIPPDRCSDKICQGFGDPHVETFDGVFYQFQAEGTFLVAAADNYDFVIEAVTKPCNSSEKNTCVVGLRVKHGGHEATARKSNMVQVDDYEVPLSDLPKRVGGITILGFPGFTYIFLIRKLSIEARFYGESSGFTVKLPSRKYFNRTIGLCGDCDNRAANELKNNPLSEFVCDHITEGSLEACKKSFVEMTEVTEFIELCDNLNDHIFGSCHALIDPKNYIQACNFDAISSNNEKESFCKVVRDYSRQCCQVGIVIKDWPSKFGCDTSCNKGLIFDECHTACPQTCESFKNPISNKDCAAMKVDGCFCPEGEVFLEGKCVSTHHCDTCDKEGHLIGDSWQEGPCKNCSCHENSVVTCIAISCPPIPVCKEGESLVKRKDNEDSCCHLFSCIQSMPLCKEPGDIPVCPVGEVAKIYTGKSTCPEYRCECDPFLCGPLVWPVNLEVGEVTQTQSDSCCPKVTVHCDSQKCPLKPICNDGLELSEIKGKCCTLYKCKPLEGVCIYTHQYEIDENGYDAPLQSPNKPSIYKLGESWQDGLCENCTCVNNDGQPVPRCLKKQCPAIDQMTDNKDYELEEILSPWQCCPQVYRMRCKDDYGDVFLPDDEWQSEENPCVKFRCELSSVGDVVKVKKIVECSECPKTSNYIPPSKRLGQCCGICRPSKCEDNGTLYEVGETWTPKSDLCRTAECISEWGQIHVVYTNPTCPAIPKDCPKDKIVKDQKGCCQICNVTSEMSCAPAALQHDETIGLFSSYHASHGGFCRNSNPIPDVLQCKGACHSEEYYSLYDGTLTNRCSCCKVDRTKSRTLDLQCPDGTTVKKQIQQPQTCHCSKCDQGKDGDVWVKPERLENDKNIHGEQKPLSEAFEEHSQQSIEKDFFEKLLEKVAEDQDHSQHVQQQVDDHDDFNHVQQQVDHGDFNHVQQQEDHDDFNPHVQQQQQHSDFDDIFSDRSSVFQQQIEEKK